MMPWILLIIAGVLEAGWAVGLKYTRGFTELLPTILTVVAIFASFYLLALAVRTLPIGTAYPVWVGIGTFGAILFEITVLDIPATPGRIFFLVLLFVSIIGLKLTSQ